MRRFFLFFSFLVICLLLALIASSFQARLQLERTLVIAEQRTLEELNRLEFFPRALSLDPRLQPALSISGTQTSDQASVTMRHWARSSGSDFVFLMNTQGTVVASSNYLSDQSFVGRNYGFRPYFHTAMNNGFASFFAVGATTGKPGYFLAHAVPNDLGQHIGVVVVKVSLTQLTDLKGQSTTDWSLVDDLGVIIVTTDQSLLYAAWQAHPDQARIATSQKRYTIAYLDLKQLWVSAQTSLYWKQGRLLPQGLTLEQKLEGTDWTLVAKLPLSDFIWLAASNFAIAALLGLVLIFGVLLYREQANRTSVLAAEVDKARRRLEATQEELVNNQSWAAIGHMSGAIVHEINQPLAGLRFDLATLGQSPSNKEALTSINQAKSTTDRMARIVETLRLFSRQNELTIEPIDINQVLTSVCQRLKTERPRASSKVQWPTPAVNILSQGNAIMIEQVLMNLLSNALRAVEEVSNPTVRVELSVQADTIKLSVSDSGPGLNSKIQQALFQPGQSSQLETQGFGLGLFISDKFCQRMRSRLNYNRENNTTEFWFKLKRV